MDVQQRRELTVLEAVAEDERITQRTLADKLGVALGLANLYLKRMVRKGYIKCVNVQSNRIIYLITPQGISEKARLTYEFLEYSFHLYRQIRQDLRRVIQTAVESGQTRIAIYGTGEFAELAYLALRESGLDPVAVFNGTGDVQFLTMAVKPIEEHRDVPFDLLILATHDGERLKRSLMAQDIPSQKIATLDRVKS